MGQTAGAYQTLTQRPVLPDLMMASQILVVSSA
jgi:hypothetical protein